MPFPTGRRKLLDPAGEQASYEHAQRRTRVIGRIVVSLLALVVMAAGAGGIVYKHIIDKVTVTAPLDKVLANDTRPTRPAANATAAAGGGGGSGSTGENILILGVDSRLGENSNFQVTSGPKQTETLSDTSILAHLSSDGKHVTLVSIPRDSVVAIPACKKIDASGNAILNSAGQPQFTKPITALFNEAVQLGGAYCAVQTLENLTQVRIDHYLEIDFTGVIKMSNALGGVTLTMCEPIRDANTGLNLPAGPVTLKGQTALAFVRARKGLTGGDDLHRIQRQQQFMASMARKALASSSLFNLPSMTTFYGEVAGSLTTDIGHSDLINLALRYRHLDTNNIVFVTVPTYPAPKGDTFFEHLYWSSDEAKALFTYIAGDRALPVVTTSGTSVGNITVPPSQVSVRVLNGTSTDNLAHQVGDELIAAGFKVVSVGSAAIVPVAKTSIIYRADHTSSEQTLASAVALAPLATTDASAGSILTLTIGQDWSGLATPSASAGASAPASPDASAVAGLKANNATVATCVQG